MRRVLICVLAAVICGTAGYYSDWPPAWIAAAVFVVAATVASRST